MCECVSEGKRLYKCVRESGYEIKAYLVYHVCVVGSECDEAVMADVHLCVVFVAP